MGTHRTLKASLARMTRECTLAVLSSLRRRESLEEVEATFDARPRGQQRLIMGLVVGGLFAASLLFAQAGLIGVGVFLLLIYLFIR